MTAAPPPEDAGPPAAAPPDAVAPPPEAVAPTPDTVAPPVQSVAKPCPNCGAPVPERFCSRCGQDLGRTPHVPLSELLGEAVSELFALDGRMARTILPFFFRPGFLTAEYLAGRRVRYSSPLRLYLLTTLLFFLVAASGSGEGGPGLRPGADGKDDFVIGYSIDPDPPAGATGPTGPTGPAGAAGPTGVTPPEKQILVGGRRELTPEEQANVKEEVARLRAKGGLFDRMAADRIERLGAMPPGEANRQVSRAMLEQAPRVLFFLVPVLAALLALLYRRNRLFFAEHFVFALHAHAVGFALLIPGEALGRAGLTAAGAAAAALHLLVGLRRVYGAAWWLTVIRFLGLALVYLVALGAGVAASAILALALL
jgi:hypothetical protein